jgi:hypothetical protein
MLPRTISPSTGLARSWAAPAGKDAAAEERAFERNVAMPPPSIAPLSGPWASPAHALLRAATGEDGQYAVRVGRLSRRELKSRASAPVCAACGACGGLRPLPFPYSCLPGAASGLNATPSGRGLPPGSGGGSPGRGSRGWCRRERRLLCSARRRNPRGRS